MRDKDSGATKTVKVLSFDNPNSRVLNDFQEHYKFVLQPGQPRFDGASHTKHTHGHHMSKTTEGVAFCFFITSERMDCHCRVMTSA